MNMQRSHTERQNNIYRSSPISPRTQILSRSEESRVESNMEMLTNEVDSVDVEDNSSHMRNELKGYYFPILFLINKFKKI